MECTGMYTTKNTGSSKLCLNTHLYRNGVHGHVHDVRQCSPVRSDKDARISE